MVLLLLLRSGSPTYEIWEKPLIAIICSRFWHNRISSQWPMIFRLNWRWFDLPSNMFSRSVLPTPEPHLCHFMVLKNCQFFLISHRAADLLILPRFSTDVVLVSNWSQPIQSRAISEQANSYLIPLPSTCTAINVLSFSYWIFLPIESMYFSSRQRPHGCCLRCSCCNNNPDSNSSCTYQCSMDSLCLFEPSEQQQCSVLRLRSPFSAIKNKFPVFPLGFHGLLYYSSDTYAYSKQQFSTQNTVP